MEWLIEVYCHLYRLSPLTAYVLPLNGAHTPSEPFGLAVRAVRTANPNYSDGHQEWGSVAEAVG